MKPLSCSLTFDLVFLGIMISLVSVIFIVSLVLISSYSSVTITKTAIASSSTEEDSQDSDEEPEGTHNFIARGDINSTIYTVDAGNWVAKGKWKLSVSNGDVVSFDTDMVWNNSPSSHTHEFFETSKAMITSF